MNMTDNYDYAYGESSERSYDELGPPSYAMSTIKEQEQTKPIPISSTVSPNTGKHTDIRPSNIPLCRVFLIIAASFIVGGVIGGAFSYLWATREGPDQECSPKSTIPTTTSHSYSCPTCPTYQHTSAKSDETDFPRDCQEVMDRGNVVSGEYMILPFNVEAAFPVWCDMEIDGGGWTVFQRRSDGSVDFYLLFIDYISGFGNISSEHWLGNQKIHQITSQGAYELRIDMSDFEGNNVYAKYTYFYVGGRVTNYVLKIGKWSGNVGDSLSLHDHAPFSTKDSDNDRYSENCASKYEGAWWYVACWESNLNGRYLRGPSSGKGNIWNTWKGHYSLKFSEMKIRRVA